MHLANVRHDGDGRRGERRERGDLPESSHADLDDSRLVRGAKAKERQRRAPSTAAVKSLVVVLPFDPVMATTGMENFLRHAAAIC